MVTEAVDPVAASPMARPGDAEDPISPSSGIPSPHAEVLRQAVADAKRALADLPAELGEASREAAFLRLLDARLGRETGRGMETDHRLAALGAGAVAGDEASERAWRVCSIARYLEIEESQVHRLFKVEGPIPIFSAPAANLAQSAADAIRQVTLVVTAARTAIDMATGTLDVRDAAEPYGKVDDDFRQAIEAVQGIALRGREDARDRRVQLLGSGLDEAKRVAQDLVG